MEKVLFLAMDSELSEAFYQIQKSNIAYTSVSKLIQKFKNKYSADKIKLWAQKQLTLQLHKPQRKNFKRNFTLCHAPFQFMFTDLIILSRLKKHNSGAQNILVVVDCLSRFAYVESLKSKKSDEVAQKMEVIINKIGVPIGNMISDGGGEYKKHCLLLYKKHNINPIIALNERTKAMIAERFIRTIMDSVSKYLTENDTGRYLDVLQQLCDNYNERHHSSIGMSPKSVLESLENQKKAFRFQYEKKLEQKYEVPKFQLGDVVRMAYYKNSSFEKGYTENWTYELFKVKKIHPRRKPVYELETLDGEDVRGKFYEMEITAATQPEFYKIERVVRWRNNIKSGEREALVHFKGHPPSARQWVPESDIKDL